MMLITTMKIWKHEKLRDLKERVRMQKEEDS